MVSMHGPAPAEQTAAWLCAASSSIAWSADGLASNGVNSIHIDDAGSEGSGSGSDAGSDCSSAAGDSERDDDRAHSPGHMEMRRKALHVANSAAVRLQTTIGWTCH